MPDAEQSGGIPHPMPYDALVDAIAKADDVDTLDELWTVARRNFAGRQLEVLEQLIDLRAKQIIDPAVEGDLEPPEQPAAG